MTTPKQRHTSRGSASVELVLLAPVLVLLVLFVVFLGRAGGATEQVRHAADVGARAASVVRFDRMGTQAAVAARRDLANNGANCSSSSVSALINHAVESSSITVTVTCQIQQAGLTLLGAGSRSVTASSTEVIDRYRAG